MPTFKKDTKGFKMKWWSAFTKKDDKDAIMAGAAEAAATGVTASSTKPKKPKYSKGAPKSKTSHSKSDLRIKKQLMSQLSNMKDPMESNRGKNISRKLMDDFGVDPEQLDALASR